MSVKKVSLTKGNDRYTNIRRSLELIRPDIDVIRSKRHILIKPNLTATLNAFANTDVISVKAVLDFLLEYYPELKNAKFTILEGSGSAYYEKKHTRDVYRDFGYAELPAEYPNLNLECVDDLVDFMDFPIASIAGDEVARLAKRLFDFDFRISVAIPKVHNYAIATFGIKNMAGLIKQEDKSLLHGLRTPSAPNAKTVFTYIPTAYIAWLRRRAPELVNFLFKRSMSYVKAVKVIHRNVANLAALAWPDLVVLDAFNCMDGNGPVDGIPVKLEAAVSSTDALKADGVGARLLGLEPEDIGYLYYLQREGRGDYSLAGFVGEDLDSVKKKFNLHAIYCIQKHWKDDFERSMPHRRL